MSENRTGEHTTEIERGRDSEQIMKSNKRRIEGQTYLAEDVKKSFKAG